MRPSDYDQSFSMGLVAPTPQRLLSLVQECLNQSGARACPAPQEANEVLVAPRGVTPTLFSRYRHNDRWECHGDEAPPLVPDVGFPIGKLIATPARRPG